MTRLERWRTVNSQNRRKRERERKRGTSWKNVEPRNRGREKKIFSCHDRGLKIGIFSRRGSRRFMIRLFRDSLWRGFVTRTGEREGETVSRREAELERGVYLGRASPWAGSSRGKTNACTHMLRRLFCTRAIASVCPFPLSP